MLKTTLVEGVQSESIRLATIVRELPADLETPVSAYMKLAGSGPSFLLESVTGGEQVARYSFIGAGLSQAYVLRGRDLERYTPHGRTIQSLPGGADPLEALRLEMARFHPAEVQGLPRFSGGLVGYLGYDTAHSFEEKVPLAAPLDQPGEIGSLPDAIFLMADTLVAFDHAFGRMLLIANIPAGDEAAYADAQTRFDRLQGRLSSPLPNRPPEYPTPAAGELIPHTPRHQFIQAVLQAKEYIDEGEIFQVVLSQRFSRRSPAAPFRVYRALRRLNPSPYMFYFDFAGLPGVRPFQMIGASPEMHVRLEGSSASLRPIAGTRPRGASLEEDSALERDLLDDPKERAEHVMLVDLARNDLGRVCEYNSISTPELMGVERYSHVMHIVSQVEGRLRPGLDGFDLLRATFPAGTVSGAPKIRAMQIISELEGVQRGPYAGVVGYFSFDGSLDTCITIRTLVMRDQVVQIQAGAGIVADSDPEREYQEILNKARVLALAVEKAEAELD